MSLDPTLYPPIPPVEDDAPRPFWSVVVPAYKSAYLARALHSIIDQNIPRDRMEILLIDDCSPEKLEPIVREVGGDRITYVRQPQNRGTYPTENAGVMMTRGQWIHIHNDDDWVLPGFYEMFERALASAPESVGAATCGCVHMDENEKEINTPPPLRGAPGVLPNLIDLIGVSNKVHPIATIFRRASFEKVGGFNLNLNYCADWEFNKRVTMHFDWWYDPKVMACYRVSASNVSSQSVITGQQLRDLRHAIELSEKYLPPDRRDKITKASREHYAIYALRCADKFLRSRDLDIAIRQIQEGFNLSSSPNVQMRFVELLTLQSSAPLRKSLVDFVQRLQVVPPDEMP